MSANTAASGGVRTTPVVLVHGLGGSHRLWDRVVARLGPDTPTHAIDLDPTDSIERDADAVAESMCGPGVIVGHSRGALVATALADRRPELVRHLVLFCPPWSVESRLTARKPAERLLAVPGIGDLMWAMAAGSPTRKALQTAFAPGTIVDEQFVIDLRKRGRRNFVVSSRAIDAYLRTGTLFDRLAHLDVPAELVFGELDQRVQRPRALGPTRTELRVHALPGVGHTPPWEAPDRTADLIRTAHQRAGERMR